MSLEAIEQHLSRAFPYVVASGWMPKPGSESLREFHASILQAERVTYAPSVEALAKLLDSNDVLGYLVQNACQENLTLYTTQQNNPDEVLIPRIADVETLLNVFNTLLALNVCQAELRFSDLEQGFPDPSLLEVVEFVLHTKVRGPEDVAADCRPVVQSHGDLSERRVALPLAS